MFQFFANIFGYVLNLINDFIGNYGLSIILFTILVKVIMLPLSIKQQKTMKKNTKIQEELKVLQFKYKNNPEKLNKETMNLYKRENMSPFSGCLSIILQFILLISIFYMVRSPLTFMKKFDKDQLQQYLEILKTNEIATNQAYYEIDIIRDVNLLKEKLPDDQNLEKINFNMNFLGIDLNKIPQQNLRDWTVFIIPILYIISTFISMKITTAMQTQKTSKNENGKEIIDITEKTEEKEEKEEKNEMEDAMAQSNKMMSWMMPVMSVSISLIAPLGLALYWLINNVLMITERLILNKVLKED